jgi:hypothetical protein
MRALLLGSASLVLVAANLGLERTARSRAEAAHLGFGYPLHFAESDFTSISTPPSYPQTYRLNPWEVPVAGNGLAFAVSWSLVYSGLLVFWLLAKRAQRKAFTRVRGRDGYSGSQPSR